MYISNNASVLIHRISLFATILFLFSCAVLHKNRLKPSLNNTLSQEIIVRKLAYATSFSSQSKVYVAPLLKRRKDILGLGEFVDPVKTVPAYFDKTPKSGVFKLLIPDSLAHRVYFIDDTLDIERTDKYCFFFSPLLPTKQNNVFALEYYDFETILDTSLQTITYLDTVITARNNLSFRFANHSFDLYSIKNKKLQFIETVSPYEDFFNVPILRFRECWGLRE
ncbi:MAG: hypothetical protein WCR52_15490 [Bacteroidota bacterium]